MHLEISLSRMLGEEQENVRPHYSCPLPSRLWAGDILGSRGLSSQDEISALDKLNGPNSSVEGLAHTISTDIIFPDPAAQLKDDSMEAKGDLYSHQSINHPHVYCMSGKLHHILLLHWRTQIFPLMRLSLADHRQDVEWSPDDESFLLFLQIVNPSLN
jgi:hypothetical protein